MNKINQFIGIDISKDTFDIWILGKGHSCFPNTSKGFNAFKKHLTPDACCVMEATGCYYQQLALFLYERDHLVSVVNPLVIKRFIQMKLQLNKTDKADAEMIAQYASEQPLKPWEPEPEYITQCKALNSTMEIYFKQRTSLKNKLQGLQSQGVKASLLIISLKRQIRQITKEILLLEQEIESLIKQNNGTLLTNVSSIPGIGKKTAMLLIAHTNGFKAFESSKQLSAYFGLAPVERTSGSSIRGKSRISKRGNGSMRVLLFMCSFTASQCNPQCKALYERITNKGKSKKLALIAVCNKLLKQAYAIANSGIPYDANYRSILTVH